MRWEIKQTIHLTLTNENVAKNSIINFQVQGIFIIVFLIIYLFIYFKYYRPLPDDALLRVANYSDVFDVIETTTLDGIYTTLQLFKWKYIIYF